MQQRWGLAASERVGTELLGPPRAGELTPQQCVTLADLCFRHRHIDAATEALARGREAGARVAEGTGVRLMGSPQAAVWTSATSGARGDTRDPDPTRERHYVLPWIAPVRATHGDVVSSAEKLFQRTVLTDSFPFIRPETVLNGRGTRHPRGPPPLVSGLRGSARR
ncbi:hypothetical protein [Streptomyces sp. MP131-18]|uniref:hypothetical protein n=1 Tax=Streptomyces sp. MP131-18 TaxID=1857892 RepID=UPI00097C1565|nr:hypothetical protein [Streptomyces sp. MP131-18]